MQSLFLNVGRMDQSAPLWLQVAVVWKKLERSEENEPLYAEMKEEIKKRKAAASGDDQKEDLIVEMFLKLKKQEVITLDSDDICDFMDKARIDEARKIAAELDADAQQAALKMLDNFERCILKLDKMDSFLSSYTEADKKQITSLKKRVRNLMSECLDQELFVPTPQVQPSVVLTAH